MSNHLRPIIAKVGRLHEETRNLLDEVPTESARSDVEMAMTCLQDVHKALSELAAYIERKHS